MTDDIVTRLREQSDEMVMLHGSPDAPDEMLFANTFWFVCQNAADEIERLREKLAKALYEETKRCGSKHDVIATWNWEEYEMDFLDD